MTVTISHADINPLKAQLMTLAPMIAAGALAPELDTFSTRRFHVQKT